MTTVNKADILTFASQAWQTTFTGARLDEAIKACLGDLNGSDLLVGNLDRDEHVQLKAGLDKILLPDTYKSMIGLTLAEPYTGQPDWLTRPWITKYSVLTELPGGISAFRAWSLNMRSGLPKWYVEFSDYANRHLRLYPVSDADYTIFLDFWELHPLTPDALVYPVGFQHLLNLGTVYWEAVLRRNKEYIEHWGPLYYAERERAEQQSPPLVLESGLV